MKSGKKYLIATISILILAGIGISTMNNPTGPYTGCISSAATMVNYSDNTSAGKKGVGNGGSMYNFQPGNNPLNPCTNGDYQTTLYEKNYIDNVIGSLVNRITNLENKPYSNMSGYVGHGTGNTMGPGVEILANYTFYLPVVSDVIIQSQGVLNPTEDFVDGDTMIALAIDRNCVDGGVCWDLASRRDYTLLNNSIPYPGEYQTWGMYRLGSGYHTVSVLGHSEAPRGVTADPIIITVIANQIN